MFGSEFKRYTIAILLLILITVMTACGGGNEEGTSTTVPNETEANNGEEAPSQEEPSKSSEPVTLQVLAGDGAFTEEEFNKYFVPSIQKAFPNITLQYVTGNAEQLVLEGNFPDIGMGGNAGMNGWLELDLPLDLNELVKKENTDLSVYVQESIESIQSYSSSGQLLALPMWINNYVALYNKDIFDRFGVEYLEDEMTWAEMTEVARSLTRLDEGVQYKGLSIGNLHQLGEQLGLTMAIDDKATLNTDGWQTVYTVLRDLYSIPGNEPSNPASLGAATDTGFFSEHNLAILASFGSRLTRAATASQDNTITFDWDVVSYPSHTQNPGVGPRFDAQVYFVSKTSDHPEEAFQVIHHVTSDLETQTSIARSGKARPAINVDNLDEIFGTDFPILQEKNIQGIFKSFPNMEFRSTPYDSAARRILREEFAVYFSGEVDLNTALRDAEEKLNAEIEVIKEQRGQE